MQERDFLFHKKNNNTVTAVNHVDKCANKCTNRHDIVIFARFVG